jgi:hypothetical protein
VEQERYVVDALLRARGPVDLDVAAALRALAFPRGGLLSIADGAPRWETFVPRARLSAAIVRTKRAANVTVPAQSRFCFRLPSGQTVAAARSIEEFDRALAEVPTASLEHHLVHGDFSRWVRDVVGDAALAAGLAKLEATGANRGAPVEREDLRRELRARYAV